MFLFKRLKTKRLKIVDSKKKKRFVFLNEKGNILIWYLMMFPVFMGGIGLAVDVSNIAAMRASLQASADAATQGAVSMSQNQASGKPRFNTTAEAQSAVIKIYDANRSGMSQAGRQKESIPFLKCNDFTLEKGEAFMGTPIKPPISKCGFILKSFTYSTTGGPNNGGYLTVTVQEKADTIFLQFLGFDDLTYTITSTARLTNTYN